MIHLVLDHSALIPCTHKPEDEKRAIVHLSDKLMNIDTTWYISGKYLKTLCTVLREDNQCYLLPKLQRDLLNRCMLILGLSRDKSRWCKPIPWHIEENGSIESSKPRIHIVGRRVSDILERYSVLLHRVPELQNLSDDDREVIAIAFKAADMVSKTVYIVTIDVPLLNVVSRVLDIVNRLGGKAVENLKKLKPLTPKQLLQEIEKE